MRKYLLLIAFLIVSVPGLAQRTGNPGTGGAIGQGVLPVTSLPSICTAVGSSTSSSPVRYQGYVYICTATNTWTQAGTGGGSLSGMTATRVQVAASGTTLTDYSTLTYDGTGLGVGGAANGTLGPLVVYGTSSPTPGQTSYGNLVLIGSSTARLFVNSNVNSPFGFHIHTSNTAYPIVLQTQGSGGTVGIGETTPLAILQVTNIKDVALPNLILKEKASQSADALQVQNSSGTVLASVTAAGNLIFGAAASSSYPLILHSGSARLGIKLADLSGFAEIESGPIRIYQTGTTTPLADLLRYSGFITVNKDSGFRWESTSTITGAADTGLSRVSAGVVGVGTGAAASVAGTLQLTTLQFASNQINITGVSTTEMDFQVANSRRFSIQNGNTAVLVGSDWMYGFSSNTDPGAASQDTAFSRISAGVVGLGTGAIGSIAGTLQLTKVSLNNACVIQSGTGSPEGAVTGNVCDLFLRTDGSTSTTLYVKTSGTGNTGWSAK